MLNFISHYLVVSLISCGILFSLAKFAPLGYEDENGFHYGTPDDKYFFKKDTNMYRKLLLPLALAFAGIMPLSQASAQEISFEFCIQLGTHGGQLMQDRQQGLPVSIPYKAILHFYQQGHYNWEYTQLLLVILEQAYSFPIQSTDTQKAVIIREFTAYVTETCLSA